ncbi:MAG: hypothetical protein A2Y38_19560 [Spirochaetes bacterium GWB1_59_5]|nr:MAG: hypothetical protein A2Y38_19560 [Spirochaetes bacterium GWB1_59_5]
MQFFTIDDAHSKDLDDALAIEQDEGGTTHVYIAITAVADAVPKGSDLDLEACKRLATHYRAHDVVRAMLPVAVGSLLPGQQHRCLVMDAVLHGTQVQGFSAAVQEIRSGYKLAYEEIPGILCDGSHKLHQAMTLGQKIALGLLEQRRKQGALALYDLNEGWYTSEEGFILRAERVEATIGHVIVQEMMILMNRLMAEYAATVDVQSKGRDTIPILYRNHTARPNAPEQSLLLEQLAAARLDPSLLDALRARIHMVVNRATYHPTLAGHYGLALPAYLHCTSPLRRYADLVNQRQLLSHFRDEATPPYTQAELVTLAEDMNQRLQEQQTQRSEAAREQAARQAGHRLETRAPELLATMSAKDFERLVKTVVRTGMLNPQLVEAVQLRMKAGTLALLDIYYLLFRTPSLLLDWADLRQQVCGYLVKNPHLAVSVLALGTNLDGWSELRFEHQAEGLPHIRTFYVLAGLDPGPGKPSVSLLHPAPASSLREGKQRAAVSLVYLIANVPPPTWERPQQTPPAAAPKPVLINEHNSVGTLQEWCQRCKRPLPEYTFQAEGDPPKFVATVTVGKRAFTGLLASTKKDAKAGAAGLACQEFLAKG